MMAKDHLNPKKSSGAAYTFLPQLFIELFDKEQSDINKNELVVMINALAKYVPEKELLKISEGGYASLFTLLAFQVCQGETLPLLDKMAVYDNVIFAQLLREPI